MFTEAEIVGYEVGEQHLVNLIPMNLNPSVLTHAAFLDRPRSRRELYGAVAVIEENVSALKERQRTRTGDDSLCGNDFAHPQSSRSMSAYPLTQKCWNCGRLGHVMRNCRQKVAISGNEQAPGDPRTTGREH